MTLNFSLVFVQFIILILVNQYKQKACTQRQVLGPFTTRDDTFVGYCIEFGCIRE